MKVYVKILELEIRAKTLVIKIIFDIQEYYFNLN